MFIATERPLAPGREVVLAFRLPGRSDPFLVRGQIVWMSGEAQDPAVIKGMGVKFLGLNPSESSAIGALVDHLCAASAAKEGSQLLPPSR
jgi:Tfp pilus assembly protein PilZ